MMTPLIRIPFIIAATIGFHRAATPPHPPPNAEENAPSTFLEFVLKQMIAPYTVTFIGWYIALAEIAVILASEYPGMPFDDHILSLFVFKGSPQNIRPTYTFFFGTCMTIAGSSIRLACFRALGRLFTFEMSIRKNHQLVMDGPYGVVRHPAYTGLLLMASGTLIWQGSPGSWAQECGFLRTVAGRLVASVYVIIISTVIIGLLLRMSKEDEQLKKSFEKEWDEWASSVPYRLIPWVY